VQTFRVIAQPASETRIAIVVDGDRAEVLAATVSKQLADVGVRVEARPAALVSIVGYGLERPDIASETIARSLRASNAQGAVWAPGSPSISLIVKPSELPTVVRRLHREVVEPWWTG
jgi:aspartokinase